MLAFTAVAPIGDAMAKILGQTIPIGQLVLIRFAVQALILLPFLAGFSMRRDLSGRLFGLIVLRTALHVLAIAAMVTALMYLPLAEAVAITFVMPFFMLILGHFVLGEEIGIRRLIACLVGFGGMLLVVQPNFAAFGWPALLPLAVALLFALFMLVTRGIAKEICAVKMQALSGLVATAALLPVLLVAGDARLPGLYLVAPDGFEWTLLLTIGLLGTVAHLLVTWALRFAPSATVAPLQYLEIPFAALIGLVIFGNLPDATATLGIAVISAAGIFILLREQAIGGRRAAARRPAASAQPAE